MYDSIEVRGNLTSSNRSISSHHKQHIDVLENNLFELGILIYSSIKLLPIAPYSPRWLQHLIIIVGNAHLSGRLGNETLSLYRYSTLLVQWYQIRYACEKEFGVSGGWVEGIDYPRAIVSPSARRA